MQWIEIDIMQNKLLKEKCVLGNFKGYFNNSYSISSDVPHSLF